MKNRPGEKIKLASLDELLGVVNEESAMEIEINKIHAFKNHPFMKTDPETRDWFYEMFGKKTPSVEQYFQACAKGAKKRIKRYL